MTRPWFEWSAFTPGSLTNTSQRGTPFFKKKSRNYVPPKNVTSKKKMPPTSTHFYYLVGCLDQPFGTLKFSLFWGIETWWPYGVPGKPTTTHQVDQGRHRFSGKNQAPWALVNPRGWVGRLGGWGWGWGFGSVRKMIVVLVDCCFVKCDLNWNKSVSFIHCFFSRHKTTKQHSDIKLCSCIVDNKPSKVQKTMTWSYMVKQCLF